MDSNLLIYSLILLVSVLISSISQAMLKKSANKTYTTVIKEYLNPLVIVAYIIFFASTLLTVFAYKYVPLSLGLILETTSYLYITIFSVTIFKEKLNRNKLGSMIIILCGIIIFYVL